MKVRKESSGLHFFDRRSGIHILLNEIKIPKDEIHPAPRTVSIALTNVCDLKCPFCYAPKNKATLSFDYLTALCEALDKLGVLEITFGGGEPTLFPDFGRLCNWIWSNTGLGVSFTTHGHLLSEQFIEQITGKVSSLRISIDGLEPYYSKIRGRSLESLIHKVRTIGTKIPFGINCVVSKHGCNELENVILLAKELNASNVLIIPEHDNGIFQLVEKDWDDIDALIKKYHQSIEILVTYEAGNFLNTSTLDVASEKEFLFAHISADNQLKVNSFDRQGIRIGDINQLSTYFSQLNLN